MNREGFPPGGDDEQDSGIARDTVETPLDGANLCLNPGRDEAPRNPLCPVCEEEIHPISNDVERRFVCDCEVIWQFTFEPKDEDSSTTSSTSPNRGISREQQQ